MAPGEVAAGSRAPWASAFSRAPGELGGWAHHRLACDGGMLPGLGREKGGKWEEAGGETRWKVPGK